MHRTILILLTGTLLIGKPGRAQLADEFNVPPANCCLLNTARALADQLQDWNQLGRYRAANEELKKSPVEPGRVVFMGDSITDFWKLDESFPGKPYVNRGIGGQVTSQMLVRLYPDVIALRPAVMTILAGTNDIARNNGPSTPEMIQQNIMAMTELAQKHGIKVLLCSILPVSDYPFLAQQAAAGRGASPPPQGGRGPGGRGPMVRQRMTVGRPPADILKLNAWMKSYAQQVNAIYVDYFSALVDEKGWLKDGLAADGLHPNAEGYKIMSPIVSAAIDQALR
uniref:Lipolytic enzyme, G-D-S-L family n=1 Tax=Solibacter usitatus (strain Ellin6076) TaxID=234267 RepID=Q026J0_SOLUE